MSDECEKAFQQLKSALSSTLVLRYADPQLLYEATTEASEVEIGGVLTQTDSKVTRLVVYTSRKLKPAEQNYHTPEREILAIIHALQEWGPYLHGPKSIINTYHHPLKYLDTRKRLTTKQAR